MLSKKYFVYSILAAIPLITATCGKSNLFYVNCSDCYSERPGVFDIELKITIDSENRRVPLTFYRGPYEDGAVEFRDTAWISRPVYHLQTDTHYTIVAKYQKNARNYYVISGARLKTHYDETSCRESCYYVTGRTADLRMKF